MGSGAVAVRKTQAAICSADVRKGLEMDLNLVSSQGENIACVCVHTCFCVCARMPLYVSVCVCMCVYHCLQ